jgi:hypothetical protein
VIYVVAPHQGLSHTADCGQPVAAQQLSMQAPFICRQSVMRNRHLLNVSSTAVQSTHLQRACSGPVLTCCCLYWRALLSCCSCRIPWPTKPGVHRYPEPLHKLVGFCLQQDPARRPSVSQLVQQVDDLLSQPDALLAL